MELIIKRTCILIAAIAAICCPSVARGETKVLERSTKKTPEWIASATEGYIVAAVQAPAIAEARSLAEQEITSQMILSVARNISVNRSNVSSEVVVNGEVESSDSYSSSTAIRGANLPFLKGISLSKAEDVYWVKVRDKDTKTDYYEYFVKYPFSRAEQQRLVAEFEEYDAGKDRELEEIESGYDTVDSMEGIRDALTTLDALSKYYFDDVRSAKVRGLTASYKELPKSIALTGSFTSGNELNVGFTIAGRRFRHHAPVTVKSNCASDLQVDIDDGASVITFDSSDCLPDEENYIEVTARIDSRKLTRRFSLNGLNSGQQNEKFSVVPQGQIVLSADSVDAASRTIGNISVRLTLNNRGTTAFGLKSIELNIPGISTPVIFDNIDGIYSTRGLIQINALAEGTYRVPAVSKSTLHVANGTITVVNPVTQAVERIRLSLPYSCNWE